MTTTARALVFTLVLATALPAAAQNYPPPPPPPPGPPPGPSYPPPSYPPPSYPPPRYPPPRYTPPRYVLPEPAPLHTARVNAGFAFVNDAWDCWYTGVGAGFCGSGFGAAWPDLNAEVDLGVSPYLAFTVGANVFWGDWNTVHNTVWEPHLDLLLRSSPYSDVRGRLRFGLGILAARASQAGFASASDTGAAFRIGVGVSFFARSRVGLGLDAVFEAGSIGGNYVSTMQLLLGPELHF